jgi:hypothetical protein
MIINTIKIYNWFFSINNFIFWLKLKGKIENKIFEPSKGTNGIILKIAKNKFIKPAQNKITKTDSLPIEK